LESNHNFLYVSLPSNLEYIILVHDVLNSIKKRKSSVLSQIIETDIDENFFNQYSKITKSPYKSRTIENDDNIILNHAKFNNMNNSKNIKTKNSNYRPINNFTNEDKEKDNKLLNKINMLKQNSMYF